MFVKTLNHLTYLLFSFFFSRACGGFKSNFFPGIFIGEKLIDMHVFRWQFAFACFALFKTIKLIIVVDVLDCNCQHILRVYLSLKDL